MATDEILRMLVRLGREAHHGGRCRHARLGDLVVEISKFDIDPDAIGWLEYHGKVPYERDAPPGSPTREVWDVEPLSGRKGALGPQRWENAEFVALPAAVAELARAAFPQQREARAPTRCHAVRERVPCELADGHDGDHRAADKRWPR